MPLLESISGGFKIQLEARHFSSGLNSEFHDGYKTFAAYVADTRDMLAKVLPETTNECDLGKAIEGNSPFVLDPVGNHVAGKEKRWRRGILLTHGLSDSPYCMKHLAACFQENGFRVLVLLLPGHGTRPGDLLDVSWQEWAKAVAFGADQLAAEADEVYLGGFSAGGALSIYQSALDKRVRGLFLFAPALEISPWAVIARFHRLVSWMLPKTKWLEIKPDRDIYKYESFTKNNVEQMYALTTVLKKQKLNELGIPIFCVASVEDKTVSARATIMFIAKQQDAVNKLILYTSSNKEHLPDFLQADAELLVSVFPEQKILGSAHTAIVVSPEDEHYGVNGDYANCIHYFPYEMEQYRTCTSNPMGCSQGEITQANLKAGTLRRLMYNPHFAEMKKTIGTFIDNLR